MRWLDSLRQSITALVLLRRIAKSLGRANELHEFELSICHPAQYKAWAGASKTVHIPTNAKWNGVTHPGVQDWNDEYRRTHPEEEFNDFEPEHDID